jgi:hypothetical protein
MKIEIGMKFGNWTVFSKPYRCQDTIYVKVKCICGRINGRMRLNNLLTDKYISHGCKNCNANGIRSQYLKSNRTIDSFDFIENNLEKKRLYKYED